MIRKKYFFLNGKRLAGLEAELGRANLVLVIAPAGYICCGYLNLALAKKIGDAACMVRGVKTVKDLLSAEIKALTPLARSRGIKVGMSAKAALAKLL